MSSPILILNVQAKSELKWSCKTVMLKFRRWPTKLARFKCVCIDICDGEKWETSHPRPEGGWVQLLWVRFGAEYQESPNMHALWPGNSTSSHSSQENKQALVATKLKSVHWSSIHKSVPSLGLEHDGRRMKNRKKAWGCVSGWVTLPCSRNGRDTANQPYVNQKIKKPENKL